MTAEKPVETTTSFRPAELEIDPDGTGHLLGSRCRVCDAHFFPIREACAGCLSDEMETVRLSARGTLYTFTVVRQSTPAFEVPYVLGYIDLPEGVRVMGQIAGCEPGELRIGQSLVLNVEPFGEAVDGSQPMGYRFRPDHTEGAS